MSRAFDYFLGLARHWLTSRTIIGVLILLFGAHLSAIGVHINQADSGVIADMIKQLLDALGGTYDPANVAETLGNIGKAVGTMIAFYGRHKADAPLPVTPTEVAAARAALPPPTP